jgi:hypothetical protein
MEFNPDTLEASAIYKLLVPLFQDLLVGFQPLTKTELTTLLLFLILT